MVTSKDFRVARRAVCAGLCGLVLFAGSVSSVASELPAVQALSAIKPNRLVLLDIVRVAKSLIAVGERGVILRSEDGGATWAGFRTEVRRTLTGLAFDGEKQGIAVGHGGVILRTVDGGRTWNAINAEEANGASLLGVTLLGPKHFIVYGAFGLLLESLDGGESWARKQVGSDSFDRHISKVFRLNRKLVLVGESATLATSADGISWQEMKSPYMGSWFGGLETKEGAALIFGMRGNVFRSDDGGANWTKVEVGTSRGVMSAAVLENGEIVLVGNAGFMARSHDDGRTFETIRSGANVGLASVVGLANDDFVVVGERGVLHVKADKK